MPLYVQPTLDGALPEVALWVAIRPQGNRTWSLKATLHHVHRVEALAEDLYEHLTRDELFDVLGSIAELYTA